MFPGHPDPVKRPIRQRNLLQHVSIFRHPQHHAMFQPRAEHCMRLVKISARIIHLKRSRAHHRPINLHRRPSRRTRNAERFRARPRSNRHERRHAANRREHPPPAAPRRLHKILGKGSPHSATASCSRQCVQIPTPFPTRRAISPASANRLPSSADPHRPDEIVVSSRSLRREPLECGGSAAALPNVAPPLIPRRSSPLPTLRPHSERSEESHPRQCVVAPNQRITPPPTSPVAASFSWAICLCRCFFRTPLTFALRFSLSSRQRACPRPDEGSLFDFHHCRIRRGTMARQGTPFAVPIKTKRIAVSAAEGSRCG